MSNESSKAGYNLLLLFVAGLGGLLYGIDVGIIAGALPYLQDTSGFKPGDLSIIVAGVMIGTTFSTLIAGFIADLIGRKWLMTFCGVLFVVSIPVIALSHGYDMLIGGRLLQGISGGFIGVVIPLYLAECLGAKRRGKGTAIFQWMLTLGFVVAALIALYYSNQVDDVTKHGTPEQVFAIKDAAWRRIFWATLPPGILFVIGTFLVAESPRWLYKKGKIKEALGALSRSRNAEQADLELKEMQNVASHQKTQAAAAANGGSLLQRKYLIPFGLALIILSCNQATGVNSVLSFCPTMLYQAGLSDLRAHSADLILKIINFLVTMMAVVLVDRKGRKFLLSLGTAGVVVSLLSAGILSRFNEKQRIDCRAVAQTMVSSNQTASISFDKATMAALLQGKSGAEAMDGRPKSLIVIFSYGDFVAASEAARSDDVAGKPIVIKREDAVPATRVAAFFKNPFSDYDGAKTAPLVIKHALVAPVPSEQNGWLLAICVFAFMASFAIGPGVCVWLALSELMPTRIRSNGMSCALFINQMVAATIQAIFLPTVGQYGYSAMFFFWSGCTVIYFLTAFFLLPETKGKTLEEIEEYFEGKKA